MDQECPLRPLRADTLSIGVNVRKLPTADALTQFRAPLMPDRIISQLVAFFWEQSGFAIWYLAAQLDWTLGYLRAPVCEAEWNRLRPQWRMRKSFA